MTELLHNSLQKLINDPIFMKIIETKLNSIMSDNKIDKTDIPDIIVLIIYCTNNLKKLNIKYKKLPIVLEELIVYLLDYFNVIPDEQHYEFIKIIQNMIKLIMFKPKNKYFCL